MGAFKATVRNKHRTSGRECTHRLSSFRTRAVELGFSENSAPGSNSPITSTTLAVYKDYFEVQFLHDTEQFYRLEAVTFLVHNSVTEYLKKVCRGRSYYVT